MKKIYMMMLAAAATALTACNNDEALTDVQEQPEILLEPVFPGEMTRAISTTTMAEDVRFHVWADAVDVSGETKELVGSTINAWTLVTTGNPPVKFKYGNTPQKWPGTNAFYFYAMHGNFSGTNSTITEEESLFPMTQAVFNSYADMTAEEKAIFNPNDCQPTKFLVEPIHTVATDQSHVSDYLASDLLYGVLGNKTTSTTALPLVFYHMLSKVVVNLTVGEGITKTELDQSTVTINNVKYKVKFLPKKLKLNDGDTGVLEYEDAMATVANRESMLTVQDAATNITLATVINPKNTAAADIVGEAAIVVPQTFAEADKTTQGINIAWSGKSVFIPFYGNLPNLGTEQAPIYKFESGKVYTFNITLDHIGTHYGFNPTVTAWTSEAEPRAIDVTASN